MADPDRLYSRQLKIGWLLNVYKPGLCALKNIATPERGVATKGNLCGLLFRSRYALQRFQQVIPEFLYRADLYPFIR